MFNSSERLKLDPYDMDDEWASSGKLTNSISQVYIAHVRTNLIRTLMDCAVQLTPDAPDDISLGCSMNLIRFIEQGIV